MNHVSRILTIGFPLLAGNLSMYLYRLADSLMVGRLGVDALAAIAVATVYTAVHEMFIWPTALGTQAIASRRYGRDSGTRETESVREVLPQAVWAGSLTGGVAFFLALGASVFVPLFAAASTDDAIGYVSISRVAFPIMGVASGFRGYLAAVHRTRIIMISIVASNVVNVAVNALFIFGWGPIPAFGVRGAAVGTVVAHALNAIVLGAAVLRTRAHCGRPPVTPHWPMVQRILRIGLPVAIQNAIAMLVILLYQWMLGALGALYQAVTYVLFSSFRLNKTLVGGFANGASILVGNALGRNDQQQARHIVRSQQMVAGGIGFLVFVAVLLFPGAVARAFALTGEAKTLLVVGLRFFAPFFLVEVLAYSLEIVFTHNGWGRYVLMSEAVTNLGGIVAITALAVFVFSWGHWGAWAGFATYQVGHAVILGYGLRSGRWLHAAVEESHA